VRWAEGVGGSPSAHLRAFADWWGVWNAHLLNAYALGEDVANVRTINPSVNFNNKKMGNFS